MDSGNYNIIWRPYISDVSAGFLQADQAGSITKGNTEKKWTIMELGKDNGYFLMLEDHFVKLGKDSHIERDPASLTNAEQLNEQTRWKVEPLERLIGMYKIGALDKPDHYWEMDGGNLKLSKIPDLEEYEQEGPDNREKFLFSFQNTD